MRRATLSCRLPGNYWNLPGNYPNLLDLASTMITDGNVQPNYRPVTSKRLPIRRTSTSHIRMCTASIITLIRSNSIECVCYYRLFKPNSNIIASTRCCNDGLYCSAIITTITSYTNCNDMTELNMSRT